MTSYSRIFGGLVGMLMIFASTGRAGEIESLSLFKNVSYLQTADGNSLAGIGAFFSADLFTVGPNAYTSVTMTYPGPASPVSVPQVSDTDYHYQTGDYASQAAMDVDFPFGTYNFSAVNGVNTDTASLSYTSDDYAQSLPYLTGTDYDLLQGMDPTQNFTAHFSPDVTGSQASASFIFFTIFDFNTSQPVFTGGFLPAGTNSLLIPANTLVDGHEYGYEIDFSNRDLVSGTGANFDPEFGFDTRTVGLFSTESTPAVPEPATAGFCLIGFASAFCARGRFRRSRWFHQSRPA